MFTEMFEHGTELEAVWWNECSLGYIIAGEEDSEYHAESIVVETVYGQMARVPWAKVTLKNGTIRMINLALVEEVIMKEKPENKKEGEELPY